LELAAEPRLAIGDVDAFDDLAARRAEPAPVLHSLDFARRGPSGARAQRPNSTQLIGLDGVIWALAGAAPADLTLLSETRHPEDLRDVGLRLAVRRNAAEPAACALAGVVGRPRPVHM